LGLENACGASQEVQRDAFMEAAKPTRTILSSNSSRSRTLTRAPTMVPTIRGGKLNRSLKPVAMYPTEATIPVKSTIRRKSVIK